MVMTKKKKEYPDRGEEIWNLEHYLSLAASGDSRSQPEEWGVSELGSSSKSTPTHNLSCDTTSPASTSTQTSEQEHPIFANVFSKAMAESNLKGCAELCSCNFGMLPSEPTIQKEESLTVSGEDSPAPTLAAPETEKDLKENPAASGGNNSESSELSDQPSLLLSSLQELSTEDLDKYLPLSQWQAIKASLKSSRRRSLARDTSDRDCLLFPTLTSGASTSNSRPAGQTKCEKWWRDKGLIPSGSQLGTCALASIMGFPSDWFKGLTKCYSKNATTPNLPTRQDVSEPDILLEEVSPQHKQRSPSEEFSICPSCASQTINLTFGCGICGWTDADENLLGGKKFLGYKNNQKNPRKNTPPSKNSPRKNRREKGEGSGSIHYRMVTKHGKEYQEAYYHYLENGKKRTRYIPKKLLHRVKEAEEFKLSVSDIVNLLGGKNKNPRKTIPPSKRRRNSGYGGGYIECKPIRLQGKQYKQYWYHYEFWEKGNRTVKKCRYIQEHLVARVQKLEAEKAPVREILKLLGVKI